MKRYPVLSLLMVLSLIFVFNADAFAQVSELQKNLNKGGSISETKEVESGWSNRGFSVGESDDVLGTARGEISAHKKMRSVEAYSGIRYNRSEKVAGKGRKTKTQDNFLFGVWGEGNFGALACEDGALLDLKSNDNSIGAGLKYTRVEQYESDYILSATKSEGVAGAVAAAGGNLYLGKNGIEIGGNAVAKVGAWAESDSGITFKAGHDRNVASVVSGISIGTSVGIGAEGNFSLRTDRVGAEVGVDVGFAKLKLGGYINPVGIFDAIIDKAKDKFGSKNNNKSASGQSGSGGSRGAGGNGGTGGSGGGGNGGSGGTSARISD